jgi:galactofuranosylgalactofuranosylrhamnosyl-N-acetylglucosaminyl-diphospho-decaprenol beta-1,5/1,6-galactofuranosyltransferase
VGGAPISSGGPATASDVGGTASVEFEIGLDPFEDGGWIWFDITTNSKVTVHSAGWYAPAPPPSRANVAVGIPTFTRPADCVNALAALTSDPLVDKVIGAVIVPTRAPRKLSTTPAMRRRRAG